MQIPGGDGCGPVVFPPGPESRSWRDCQSVGPPAEEPQVSFLYFSFQNVLKVVKLVIGSRFFSKINIIVQNYSKSFYAFYWEQWKVVLIIKWKKMFFV